MRRNPSLPVRRVLAPDQRVHGARLVGEKTMKTYRLKTLVRPIDCPWLDRAFGPDTLFHDAPDAKGSVPSRGKPVRLSAESSVFFEIPYAYLEVVL